MSVLLSCRKSARQCRLETTIWYMTLSSKWHMIRWFSFWYDRWLSFVNAVSIMRSEAEQNRNGVRRQENAVWTLGIGRHWNAENIRNAGTWQWVDYAQCGTFIKNDLWLSFENFFDINQLYLKQKNSMIIFYSIWPSLNMIYDTISIWYFYMIYNFHFQMITFSN